MEFSFKLADMPAEDEFDNTPLPSGNYEAVIKHADQHESKSGNTSLKLEWQIVEGNHKGRLIWQYINAWHESERTREIAMKELGRVMRAVGIDDLNDVSQLRNKLANIHLKVTPPNGDFGPGNRVTGCAPAGGGSGGKSGSNSTTTVPAGATQLDEWDQD